MRNRSLLAHELLRLHLKSFYGVEACSLTKKAGKRFRLTTSLRLRK
jgi:hypothetical protein